MRRKKNISKLSITKVYDQIEYFTMKKISELFNLFQPEKSIVSHLHSYIVSGNVGNY